GRFTNGFQDDIIIRSPWGIGILTYKDSWLSSSVIAPNGTRFGGWLYNSAADKILGKGSFTFLRDSILIGSEWGLGLLTVASSGSTLQSLMLAPNGTFFGNWPLDLTVDRLGIDKDIGAQTVPTWVSGRAQ